MFRRECVKFLFVGWFVFHKCTVKSHKNKNKVKSETDDNASQASSSSGHTSSSRASSGSAAPRTRAKAEAARARASFAEEEMKIKKQKARLEAEKAELEATLEALRPKPPEVAHQHTHLSPVAAHIPELDSNAQILLLLGRDILRVHKVRQQINEPGNTPFAQRLGPHLRCLSWERA